MYFWIASVFVSKFRESCHFELLRRQVVSVLIKNWRSFVCNDSDMQGKE